MVKLLAYISDKDLFAEFYRKRLARRLLQDKSASDDHERSILTRLKQQASLYRGACITLAIAWLRMPQRFDSRTTCMHACVTPHPVRRTPCGLQCGAQFTSKMEGMVTDLQLAREKQQVRQCIAMGVCCLLPQLTLCAATCGSQNFEDWQQQHSKSLSIEMTVTVLTTGFWPTYKQMELALPQEMVRV